jgi:hypothetical protein
MEVVVGVVGGVVACRVADGGVAKQFYLVTTSSSLFSRWWLDLRRRRCRWCRGGIEKAGSGGSAAATGGDGCAGSSHVAVAARRAFAKLHRASFEPRQQLNCLKFFNNLFFPFAKLKVNWRSRYTIFFNNSFVFKFF